MEVGLELHSRSRACLKYSINDRLIRVHLVEHSLQRTFPQVTHPLEPRKFVVDDVVLELVPPIIVPELRAGIRGLSHPITK